MAMYFKDALAAQPPAANGAYAMTASSSAPAVTGARGH
jgi:hypothetical protein